VLHIVEFEQLIYIVFGLVGRTAENISLEKYEKGIRGVYKNKT